MTVTALTSNNSPAHIQAATLLANIATQTTLVAALANGSQGKIAAASKLLQMQREAVYMLMNSNILSPATILANEAYGS